MKRKIVQRWLVPRTGGVPPDQVKGKSTLASGYLGQVNVSVCDETTLARARTTAKALSNDHEDDSNIMAGSKEPLRLGLALVNGVFLIRSSTAPKPVP